MVGNKARFEQMPDEWKACVLFAGLLKDQMVEYLRSSGLPVSGTKAELTTRVERALLHGEVFVEDVLATVDRCARWGPQHIFVFDAQPAPQILQTEPSFAQAAQDAGFGSVYRTRAVHFLPDSIEIVHVDWQNGVVTIEGIVKHEGFFRDEEHDERRQTQDGRMLLLKGYVEDTRRGLISLEWDTTMDSVLMQVSQLPSGLTYEDVRADFLEVIEQLVSPQLQSIDLRRVVKRAHEEEENGAADIRCAKIDLESLGGRRLSASSGSLNTPLLGEAVVDAAIRGVRQNGLGRLGSIYFGPNGPNVSRAVHVYVIASRDRVNFPTVRTEEEVRYVAGRLRGLV